MESRFTEEDIKKRFIAFKRAVRKFPTDILIRASQDILLKKPSIFNLIYERNIEKSINRELLPFILTNIAEASILYSDQFEDFNKNNIPTDLFQVFHTANEYFVACLEVRNHSNAEYNIINLLFRLGDYQLSYQNSPHNLSLAFYMFCKLSTIKDDKLEKFNFNEKFKEVTGIHINEFFKSLLVIHSAAMTAKYGWFPIGDVTIMETGFTIDQQSVYSVLEMLSSSFKDFKKAKEKFNITNYRSKIYEFNLLRIKPILKFYDKNTQIYIAPNPHLIVNQAIDQVYYIMKNKYSHTFTEFFSRLLEIFCMEIVGRFQFSSNKTLILGEDEIRKKFNRKNKSVPDFAIINESKDICVLIECKAARINRDVITNNNFERFCDVQMEHIRKAYKQISSFSDILKNNYNFKEVYGIVVTYDQFPTLITQSIKKFFPELKFQDDLFIYTTYINNFNDFPLATSNRYDIFDVFRESMLDANPYAAFDKHIRKGMLGKKSNVKEFFDALGKDSFGMHYEDIIAKSIAMEYEHEK